MPDLPAPDTRTRIVATALELFNTQGAHAVSTRHVAAALGMSPGNLYYHFGNKEEIVVALYALIESDLDELLRPPAGPSMDFTVILGYVDRLIQHLWRYRFFYRDLPTLLPAIPGLSERFRGLAARACAGARSIYATMIEAGWMQATPAQLDLLAENGWIVLCNWLPYRQLRDGCTTIDARDINEGVRHFAALFGAYLKPGPQAELNRRLDRYESAALITAAVPPAR